MDAGRHRGPSEFEPHPRKAARRRGPNTLQRRKADEIEALRLEGVIRLGELSELAFLAAGAALYAGEGSKTDGVVKFANSDPEIMSFFCSWLRHFFDLEESRLTMRIYLHEGLDLDGAECFWSNLCGIPREQFRKPYRAIPDPSIRRTKHELGCAYVSYTCSRTHRAIMGLIHGLLSSCGQSGVAQPAEHAAVNRVVESSSLSPGAQAERGYSLSR